ncbi:uncharacterized protein LOC111638679 [Centruroides sculpturatus]|uniref:uncharacterized protein LOC111638679 n=1 Tax=Centruroides sculpturatus TaxID=218467 RepID=UPI000C6EE5A6|nr:uncharacterized protein LOC111638679 [Centruroides sculpturatus]
MVIDGHAVIAEFIKPADSTDSFDELNHDWYIKHVRESQYLLQITKCDDVQCCGLIRSNIRTILTAGFLPAPCQITHDEITGLLKVPQTMNHADEDARFMHLFQRLNLESFVLSQTGNQNNLPYDYFCPTIQSQIKERTCFTCHMYFASKKKISEHKKLTNHKVCFSKMKPVRIEARRKKELLCVITDDCTLAEDAEWMCEDDVERTEFLELKNDEVSESDSLPVIESLENWLKNPWTSEN